MSNHFNAESLRKSLDNKNPKLLNKNIIPKNKKVEKYICRDCHKPYLGYDYGLCYNCDSVQSGILTNTLFIISDCFSYNNGKPDQFSGYYSVITNDQFNLDDEFNIEVVLKKAFKNTTNNYGEMRGVLDGLLYFLENKQYEIKECYSTIIVVSDSEYVIKGAGERMYKWKENGWKNSSGQVKNLELWKLMYEVCSEIKSLGLNLIFKHQKGHVVNGYENLNKVENPILYFQEMCDNKAVEIKEKIKKSL